MLLCGHPSFRPHEPPARGLPCSAFGALGDSSIARVLGNFRKSLDLKCAPRGSMMLGARAAGVGRVARRLDAGGRRFCDCP